ncbi:MAG: KpsF/GutQ family sugar-phosphate isomerase [Pseudomonadota bacterium]
MVSNLAARGPARSSAADIGVEVIDTETQGLGTLRGALHSPDAPLRAAFEDAVDLCERVEGRLIVTGMGKSGHIARKIAATLASTGMPASFVHPGEASHGDLGMISRKDAILALSNSGETPELRDVLGYAGRFSIPLIAMTAGAGSTLAQAGNVALVVPKTDEACDVTRAPTTSTTVMIALGDALAVAILKRKGFTAQDFHAFHPGGKLGAALRRVSDLMHEREMPLCRPDDTVEKAVAIMSDSGFGCVGAVGEDGRLIGLITDGDLRRHFSRSLSDARVADVMTKDPLVVREDSLAAEAMALFSDRKITSVFIVDDAGKPLGLLHVHDCLSVGVV